MSCLFVEQLTVIDFSYLDRDRGVVGESWIVDVELEGDLDQQSMVLDFGEVKKRLKHTIDNSVDHTLAVPLRAAGTSVQYNRGRIDLRFDCRHGSIEMNSPQQAVTLVDSEQIDQLALIAHLMPLLRACVPANVERIGLSLGAESIDGAYYHYTHGLKKHAGHCQRIAHGHRSKIRVYRNGQRASELEAEIAGEWQDIYVATREDLREHRDGRCRFDYLAPEGEFSLSLPETLVSVIDTDSTVERIADFWCQILAKRYPGDAFEVRAYEGVMKGAVSRSSG